MDIYAVTLAVAAGFCALAAIALGIAKWRSNHKASQVCKFASASAIAFDVVSLVVHRFFGHATGSPEALGGQEFLTQHPAFLIVGAVSLILLYGARASEAVKKSRIEYSLAGARASLPANLVAGGILCGLEVRAPSIFSQLLPPALNL